MPDLSRDVLRELGWSSPMWEVNTGVMFARANEFSLDLAEMWLRAARDNVDHCRKFKNRWPTEQNCLIHVLRALDFMRPDVQSRVYSADAQEFNTPWGAFISHMWGGIGGGVPPNEDAIFIDDAMHQRAKALGRDDRIEEMWRIQGVWSHKIRKALMYRALRNTRDFIC